jgi:hypothetical protein
MLTMERYAREYINKPNPSSGRPFWYDSEVAEKEGCSVSLVAELRNFYQTEIARVGATPESVIAKWNARGGVIPPVAKSSGAPRLIGDVPEEEYWTHFQRGGKK